MKSMMLSGIRQMEMMEVPEPVIVNPGDVKIKMLAVGVCGSDIHYYTQGRIGSQIVKYPFTVGHEGAGIVVEVGRGVKRVKSGDIIAIEPAMPCWVCDQCLAGRHGSGRPSAHRRRGDAQIRGELRSLHTGVPGLDRPMAG